ncbi:40S ribosomal protein S8-like [Hydractinia symbiolongicarpus]|uniref:40S ribosomal protein S8-like n=1 Tax=Hydractinia symbiolongicarpus TaxID=13093 RepID=UPI00254D0DE1|nr:40S ribosomal protein S8-like [Hydractinia symbiolongicarpus]
MGISRDSWHKRRATGGRKKPLTKKRKHCLGRPAANTRIGAKRIHTVRCRGGNLKFRAMRLDAGNYSWGSESITRKTRILDVLYNASNNELVRTKTLVKNAIVHIDGAPFKQWFEAHYGVAMGRKKGYKAADGEEDVLNKTRSHSAQRKIDARKPGSKVEQHLEEQFTSGRVMACISSRPGQSGRCDGYILEGKELDFYLKKLKTRKGK